MIGKVIGDKYVLLKKIGQGGSGSVYLARDLRFGETHLDEDEFLNLERIPFGTLVEQVLSGEIKDAKTIAAALKAKLLLEL